MRGLGTVARGLWSGVLSAWICYAEYLGMGAVLGSALLGYGAQNKAAGTLLVVMSACIACCILAFSKKPYLSGPRGASLALAVVVLVWLRGLFPGPASDQVIQMAAMGLGCGAMVALSSCRVFQKGFDSLPPWLMPAFIYASAVGIFGGAVKQYLHSCLLIHELHAWGIFLGATLIGVLWPLGCRSLAFRCSSSRLAKLTAGLQSLALPLAAGVAWGLYLISDLNLVQGPYCAKLGGVDIDLALLNSRVSALIAVEAWPSFVSLACAALGGVLVGGVVAMETQTTVQSLNSDYAQFGTFSKAEMLKSAAVAGTLMAAAATPTSALSLSRTQTLWALAKPSPFAVWIHVIALAVTALYAGDLIAGMPQIALAVLMALIAIQMIGGSLVSTWRKAYDPNEPITTGLRNGLGLWLVIGLTVFTGQVLLAFLVPALIFFANKFLRLKLIKNRSSLNQKP